MQVWVQKHVSLSAAASRAMRTYKHVSMKAAPVLELKFGILGLQSGGELAGWLAGWLACLLAGWLPAGDQFLLNAQLLRFKYLIYLNWG